eukprot:6187744-Pleurochrysis_carterae.AAC.1
MHHSIRWSQAWHSLRNCWPCYRCRMKPVAPAFAFPRCWPSALPTLRCKARIRLLMPSLFDLTRQSGYMREAF